MPDINSASSFMDLVNRKFFSPLTGQNNKLLFECISLLMDSSEDFGVLYEKEAKRILQEYIEKKQDEIEDDTENEGWSLRKNASPSDNARLIINRFRDCGWLTANELGQNGESLASVTKYCRKMIEALNDIYNEDIGDEIKNAIFSMYEILKSAIRDKEAYRRERPYTEVLLRLLRLKRSADDKLSDLNDKITIIAKIANSKASITEFGDFLGQDEYRDSFFAEYEKLNQRGLVTSNIEAVHNMLLEFKADPLYDRAVNELMEKRQTDIVEAEGMANGIYDEIYRFINTGYSYKISRLDAKINANYILYTRKIRVLASDENNTHTQIRLFMDKLSDMEERDAIKILNRMSENTVNIYKLEMMDFNSVKRKGHIKKDHGDTVMPLENLSEKERNGEKLKMLNTVREPYSLKRTEQYFDGIVPKTGELTMNDFTPKTENDVLMLVSAMLYQGAKEFGYVIEPAEGETVKEKVRIKNMTIRRKDSAGKIRNIT